jgi:hypothetical protein
LQSHLELDEAVIGIGLKINSGINIFRDIEESVKVPMLSIDIKKDVRIS